MKKTKSKWAKVKKSGIHNKGMFAKKNIPKGTYVIEYVGEKTTKKESDRRADIVLEKSKADVTKGAVYIFELNKRYDIDGNVKWNTARWINHSCNPNCEAVNDEGHIWIETKKDIRKGEEITYNYGYNLDNFEEHPCKCGSKNCVGYIVEENLWPKLKKTKAYREKHNKSKS